MKSKFKPIPSFSIHRGGSRATTTCKMDRFVIIDLLKKHTHYWGILLPPDWKIELL